MADPFHEVELRAEQLGWVDSVWEAIDQLRAMFVRRGMDLTERLAEVDSRADALELSVHLHRVDYVHTAQVVGDIGVRTEILRQMTVPLPDRIAALEARVTRVELWLWLGFVFGLQLLRLYASQSGR